MTDGEVAVREGGAVTAVDTDTLDDNISVDLDSDPPSVGVPAGTAVVYEEDGLEATSDPGSRPDSKTDEQVAADGGHVRNRVTMRQYGLGLRGGTRNLAGAVMAMAYAASGYLVANSEATAGLVTFAAAAFVTYVLFYRRAGQ